MNPERDEDTSVEDTPATLHESLDSFRIGLPTDQIEQLNSYCQTLWTKNQHINLTRHTDYQRFVTRDLADTLQLSALLDEGKEILDLGTGGGVPGIVLAIVRPDLRIELCESVRKKAVAVAEIVDQLGLSVPVHHSRAEQLLDDLRYDAVVARAVGPMWKILTWLEPHWLSVGELFLFKGPKWLDERHEARTRGLLKDLDLRKAASYPMPESDSECVILRITPSMRG